MMLLDTPLDPLSSFRAPLFTYEASLLIGLLQVEGRKSENMKIRHCLIDQATARLKLVSYLIGQTAS